MTDLYDAGLAGQLPESMERLAKVQAFSYAVMQGGRRVIDLMQSSQVVMAPELLDIGIVDALAAEENSPYYDSSAGEAIRRQTYADTTINYIQAGTKAAVQRLVDTVFGSGLVEEWQEYSSDPFNFRITLQSGPTTDMVAEMDKILPRVKNERSILETLRVLYTDEQHIYIGHVLHETREITPSAESMPAVDPLSDYTFYTDLSDNYLLTGEGGDILIV